MCFQISPWISEIFSSSYDVNYSNPRLAWIPWNVSFCYIHCNGQFTPKMKANAEPRLLSSLVWIDQYSECNRMTHFMEFMLWELRVGGNPVKPEPVLTLGKLGGHLGRKAKGVQKLLTRDAKLTKNIQEEMWNWSMRGSLRAWGNFVVEIHKFKARWCKNYKIVAFFAPRLPSYATSK